MTELEQLRQEVAALRLEVEGLRRSLFPPAAPYMPMVRSTRSHCTPGQPLATCGDPFVTKGMSEGGVG